MQLQGCCEQEKLQPPALEKIHRKLGSPTPVPNARGNPPQEASSRQFSHGIIHSHLQFNRSVALCEPVEHASKCHRGDLQPGHVRISTQGMACGIDGGFHPRLLDKKTPQQTQEAASASSAGGALSSVTLPWLARLAHASSLVGCIITATAAAQSLSGPEDCQLCMQGLQTPYRPAVPVITLFIRPGDVSDPPCHLPLQS